MSNVSFIDGHIDPDTSEMTPQEALSIVEGYEKALKEDQKFLNNGDEFHIEALKVCEVVKQALEKQIPKKFKKVTWVFKNKNDMRLATESDVLTKDNHITLNHCPCCDMEPIVVKYLSPPRYDLYCKNCGQALDWSDTE